MTSKLELFAREIVETCQDKVITIATLGSRHGEIDMSLSDIDLFILCRSRADIHAVFETAVKLKEKIFHLRPTKLSGWMERFLLSTNSYNGIQLILVGKDEFDEHFRPVSLRLKILTKILSRNIFLYELKHGHDLLHGENIFETIKVGHLGFYDRVPCYMLPALTLLVLPFSFPSKRDFKIWCFKAVKWHFHSLSIYDRILEEEHDERHHHELYLQAKEFRYKPDDFQQNVVALYFRIWWSLLKNSKLLFRR